MSGSTKVVITGSSAVCGAGRDPQSILDAIREGRSAIRPIEQWDASEWPVRNAAEIPEYNATKLVPDRKLHKLIRRTDILGLYAAAGAFDEAAFEPWRGALPEADGVRFADRFGVFVGSGAGTYQTQYDFFPLMAETKGDMPAFGRELPNVVNPMWLLRTLPNNVLCHVGIRHGLKGANACITNHSVGGALAVIEAAAALDTGEADRAIAVAHDSQIEPQTVLYYQRAGLLAQDALRPFDGARDGSVFGEGAGALVLETEAAARARDARVIGEYLGGASVSEARGLLEIRDDGDGLARAIALALDDANVAPGDVGMVVAHGNGTPLSDFSEARALRRIFGDAMPPATAFKWSFGHLLAAAPMVETVLALAALRRREVPGIATLRSVDPDCAGVAVSASAQTPRSDVALVLSRGFGGTDAALVVRAGSA
jgi:3-oxoacyl-(acyl-carrier-protein) synthase